MNAYRIVQITQQASWRSIVRADTLGKFIVGVDRGHLVILAQK